MVLRNNKANQAWEIQFWETEPKENDHGALHHHKSAKDTKRHLECFKSTIGSYALTYVTPELLTNERKKLLQTAKLQGKSRTASTANRYFSSLSGLLRYACRNLRWIDDNPCANLLKLKENPRKRRMLTSEEEVRLLSACKKSKNPYFPHSAS